jgi:hypothetical protein
LSDNDPVLKSRGLQHEAHAMWNHKIAGALLCVVLCCTSLSEQVLPSGGAPTTQGLRYKKASKRINNLALNRLRQVLVAPIEVKLSTEAFADKVICGPFLWRKVKSLDGMKVMKRGEVVIHVPLKREGVAPHEQRLLGRLFQTAPEIHMFFRALRKVVGRDETFKVRPPTKRELRIYWAMVPYDIEEPIFILETKAHTFIIDFIAGKDKIFWVDDFRGVVILPSGRLRLAR